MMEIPKVFAQRLNWLVLDCFGLPRTSKMYKKSDSMPRKDGVLRVHGCVTSFRRSSLEAEKVRQVYR